MITKCKHCINKGNRFFDGFCFSCFEKQRERYVTLKLSNDDLNYVSELLLREAFKSEEPRKSNLKELADRFYKKIDS